MSDDKLREQFTICWTRVMQTPMSMSIKITPFLYTKKVRGFSWWSRWLLRSIPVQSRTERDPFGDDMVVYFKQRKNTVYLIGVEWVDKPRAIEHMDAPIRAALAKTTEAPPKRGKHTNTSDGYCEICRPTKR